MSEDRPKTIPELRGHAYTLVPRLNSEGVIDDRLYNARSYVVFYGITIEEAEEVREMCNIHTQADRMISSTLAADPTKLRAALGKEDDPDYEELEQYRNASPRELMWKVRQMMGEMAKEEKKL